MRTQKLIGALLDAWVARAMGKEPVISPVDGKCRIDWKPSHVPCQRDPGKEFSPSTNWAQGGQIMESNGIVPKPCLWLDGQIVEWAASIATPSSEWGYWTGDTVLIAAMRAYVASKFGNTVPDEVQ